MQPRLLAFASVADLSARLMDHLQILSNRYTLAVMSELLFEGYSAPSVAYSIDSLMSLYANSPTPPTTDALVISSSTASTHVIPVLHGKAVMTSAKK